MTDLATRWGSVMVPNYGTPTIQIIKGTGSRVEAADGTTYIDLLAGVAVNVLGHAHPSIVKAVRAQVAELSHTSNLYANEPALRLAERLQAYAHGHKALLVNSGTEANEFAYKAVRKHAHTAGRADGVIIAFNGSFHGRTAGSLALTGQPAYHAGFGPLPAQIVHVPYNDADALDAAFEAHDVVGVFAEFVQGEGGVTPMAAANASHLADKVRASGALLVADEVQTGVGRTGRFFAFEHHGVEPDIITMAKGIGGGLPLGAALVKPEVAAGMGPGTHGCTFGGNAVCAAAGNAVLDVYEAEALGDRAAKVGATMLGALADAFADDGIVPRGQGLLLGVPLGKPVAPAVTMAMAGAGYLVGQAGAGVTRLAPPLVIDEVDLFGAVEPLVAAVRGALVG